MSARLQTSHFGADGSIPAARSSSSSEYPRVLNSFLHFASCAVCSALASASFTSKAFALSSDVTNRREGLGRAADIGFKSSLGVEELRLSGVVELLMWAEVAVALLGLGLKIGSKLSRTVPTPVGLSCILLSCMRRSERSEKTERWKMFVAVIKGTQRVALKLTLTAFVCFAPFGTLRETSTSKFNITTKLHISIHHIKEKFCERRYL